jgi:SAM-dependent methyltransferase
MNPYSYLQRALHCARTNGPAEVVKIPLRMVLSPLAIRLLGRRKFTFRGSALEYFYHRYNVTWCNERAVEVPIAKSFLNAMHPGLTLEIGNVMSHYQPVEHAVVDRYEHGAGVLNFDVLDLDPGLRYGLILSISTFEHIGFDEEPKDDTKIARAIDHCRRMLLPGGKLVITAAAGYNPVFDRLMLDLYAKNAGKFSFMRRTRYFKWEECGVGHYAHARYNHPYPFGNAVVVAEYGPL